MITTDEFALQVSGLVLVMLIAYLMNYNRKSGQITAYATTTGSAGERVVTLTQRCCPLTDQEDQAMLLALISRSSESTEALLAKVYKNGSSGFIEKYYTGFGDESIGDLGTSVFVIENVSLLAAKHIQHDRLYRGIESSTRYINFQQELPPQRFCSNDRYDYAQRLMSFYEKAKQVMIAHWKLELDASLITKNGLMAQIYDVCRGFLPAGASTTVAVKMNLRQLSNTIQRLDNSPITEVASVAESLLAAARLRHPHSFKNVVNGMNKDQNSRVLQEALLRDPPPFSESFPKYTGKIGEFTIPVPSAGSADLELYYPCVQAVMEIDWGCYRDIQRHNCVDKNLPRLTAALGFENWYIERLPVELQAEARDLVTEGRALSEQYNDQLETQYCLPMGFKVRLAIKGGFTALRYICKLRTNPGSHPVLVKRVVELLGRLEKHYPGVFDASRFADPHEVIDKTDKAAIRGKQTIAPL